MKKIMIFGAILLTICISISAVSAFEFSFDSSSSDSSNSNGGSVSLKDNELTIQDFKFIIPEGYKENKSAQILAEDADQNAFPGFKITTEQFDNGEDSIIIKVVFGDDKMDGYLSEYNDGVSFDYIEDGKLVEIFAPDEETLSTLLSSSE